MCPAVPRTRSLLAVLRATIQFPSFAMTSFDECTYPTVRLTLAVLELYWSHDDFPTSMVPDDGTELNQDLEKFLDMIAPESTLTAVRALKAELIVSNIPYKTVECRDPIHEFLRVNGSNNKRMRQMVTTYDIEVDRWLGTNFCLQCNCFLYWRKGQRGDMDRSKGRLCHKRTNQCLYPKCWFKYLVVPAGSPKFSEYESYNFCVELSAYWPQRVIMPLRSDNLNPILFKLYAENKVIMENLHLSPLEETYFDPLCYKVE
jgi:hypothetical protein